MLISAIIVEDQQSAIDELKYELESSCPEIEVVAISKTLQDAFQQITQLKPQLVFLDIDLGKNTSFELLELFETIYFKVIFITGHNDFAIKAIKFSALDYILKPVGSFELIQAVQKAKLSIANEKNFGLLKEQIKDRKLSAKIALNLGDQIELVNIQEIIHCEADEHYCHVYLTSARKLYVSCTIKDFEFLLIEHGFYRIHKSHLINIEHVKTFTQKEGGQVTMSNGQIVYIAQRKRQHFFDLMKKLFKL